MSKIKINKIESLSNNGDLTITPNGTGVFEVASDGSDATLNLSDTTEASNVKIKAPPSSAGQSHTMILPSNNIAADKFLKVNSITGSGATAVGQLGFETVTADDATNLNASNFNSGTVPTARYSLNGSAGAGYQLISKSTVTTDDQIVDIVFTGLVDGGLYKIMANFNCKVNVYIYVQWLKSSYDGTFSYSDRHDNIGYYRWDDNNDDVYIRQYTQDEVNLYVGTQGTEYFYEIELHTATTQAANAQQNWMMVKGQLRGEDDNKCEAYASFDKDNTTDRIQTIRFVGDSSNNYFQSGTEVLLYKYNES